MFSLDSLVELLKSIIKIVLLLAIAVCSSLAFLPDTMKLVQSTPTSLAAVMQSQTVTLVGWTMGLFAAVAMVDLSYQKYSHSKKLMMSLEDIKQEHKNSEGDPLIKQQRQQLAREWAQESAETQAREATVLVVNPTHVAIALQYDKQSIPIPLVTARGIDDNALAMRYAAQAAGVPVLRNIPLARKLLAETDNGDFVPGELFDIIAEVILWANEVKNALEDKSKGSNEENSFLAPGEDLTAYSPTALSTPEPLL